MSQHNTIITKSPTLGPPNPATGGKKVKMIARLAPTNGCDDISSQLHLDGIADSSD